MDDAPRAPSGFATTLLATAGFEDPQDALPLLELSLLEEGPVRREALRFLLSRTGLRVAGLVVRNFHRLHPAERSEALAERERLLSAASSLLAETPGAARAGVAAFAAALPPGEGLSLLQALAGDPSDETRRPARAALLRAAEEYLASRLSFAGPAGLRLLVRAVAAAIETPAAGDLSGLVSCLLRAGGELAEARAALLEIVEREDHPARASVIEALETSDDPVVARVLFALVGSGPAQVRERAGAVIRARREPGFLRAVAEEAACRMESPGGVPVPLAQEVVRIPWENLRPEDLGLLSAATQRRLFSIVRRSNGEPGDRARRIAVFLQSRDLRTREMAKLALGDLRREIGRKAAAARRRRAMPAEASFPAARARLFEKAQAAP